jgi:hypothetical protein
MNVNDYLRRKRRRLLGVVLGLLCGAAIGLAMGLLIRRELPVGLLLASGGALVGGIAGSNVIRTTGWLMLAGATVGGIAAIWVNANGKAALYGVPIGTMLGLAVGYAIEKALLKRLG